MERSTIRLQPLQTALIKRVRNPFQIDNVDSVVQAWIGNEATSHFSAGGRAQDFARLLAMKRARLERLVSTHIQNVLCRYKATYIHAAINRELEQIHLAGWIESFRLGLPLAGFYRPDDSALQGLRKATYLKQAETPVRSPRIRTTSNERERADLARATYQRATTNLQGRSALASVVNDPLNPDPDGDGLNRAIDPDSKLRHDAASDVFKQQFDVDDDGIIDTIDFVVSVDGKAQINPPLATSLLATIEKHPGLFGLKPKPGTQGSSFQQVEDSHLVDWTDVNLLEALTSAAYEAADIQESVSRNFGLMIVNGTKSWDYFELQELRDILEIDLGLHAFGPILKVPPALEILRRDDVYIDVNGARITGVQGLFLDDRTFTLYDAGGYSADKPWRQLYVMASTFSHENGHAITKQERIEHDAGRINALFIDKITGRFLGLFSEQVTIVDGHFVFKRSGADPNPITVKRENWQSNPFWTDPAFATIRPHFASNYMAQDIYDFVSEGLSATHLYLAVTETFRFLHRTDAASDDFKKFSSEFDALYRTAIQRWKNANKLRQRSIELIHRLGAQQYDATVDGVAYQGELNHLAKLLGSDDLSIAIKEPDKAGSFVEAAFHQSMNELIQLIAITIVRDNTDYKNIENFINTDTFSVFAQYLTDQAAVDELLETSVPSPRNSFSLINPDQISARDFLNHTSIDPAVQSRVVQALRELASGTVGADQYEGPRIYSDYWLTQVRSDPIDWLARYHNPAERPRIIEQYKNYFQTLKQLDEQYRLQQEKEK